MNKNLKLNLMNTMKRYILCFIVGTCLAQSDTCNFPNPENQICDSISNEFTNIDEIDSTFVEKKINFFSQKLKKLNPWAKDEGNSNYLKIENNYSEIIKFGNSTFKVFVYDMSDTNTELKFNHLSKKNTPILTMSNLIRADKKKMIFATNGGIFNPQFNPEGLYIENSTIVSPLNTLSGFGNFYLQPNGVFYITKWNKAGIATTLQTSKILPYLKYATQSGPMLVSNGKINQVFDPNSKNLKLRSGVGIINNQKIVFAISEGDVSFYEFASLFLDHFKCKNALYLDGVISKMYTPLLNKNVPEGEFSILISVSKK